MKSYSDELAPPPIPDSPLTVGAGFGIRFLARFIDLIYGYVLAFVAMFCGGIVLAVLSSTGRISEDWVAKIQVTGPLDYLLAIVGYWLYHSFTDGISGTSLGKLICRLNVVGLDGRPCTLPAAFLRDLAYYVDALFFGLIGYESMKKSSLRQRYGDVWAKTVVARKADFMPTPKVTTLRLLSGLALGSLAMMAVHLVDLWLKVR